MRILPVAGQCYATAPAPITASPVFVYTVSIDSVKSPTFYAPVPAPSSRFVLYESGVVVHIDAIPP